MSEHATEMLACIIHDAIYPDSQEDMMTWPPAIFTAANNILAAGYRKPRTITTAEELDALPDAVLVLTEQGGYWESIKRMDGRNWWHEPGNTNVSPSEDLALPATIIHEGDQP